MMSGPQEPPSNETTLQPWARSDKGKVKMPQYDVDHHDESHSDVSTRSLHSEFGVPIMQTLGLKKTLGAANEKFWCLSREKNVITWYGYNEFMAHHYTFMMKVVGEQEYEHFTEAVCNHRWMEAMDEEIQALSSSAIGIGLTSTRSPFEEELDLSTLSMSSMVWFSINTTSRLLISFFPTGS